MKRLIPTDRGSLIMIIILLLLVFALAFLLEPSKLTSSDVIKQPAGKIYASSTAAYGSSCGVRCNNGVVEMYRHTADSCVRMSTIDCGDLGFSYCCQVNYPIGVSFANCFVTDFSFSMWTPGGYIRAVCTET